MVIGSASFVNGKYGIIPTEMGDLEIDVPEEGLVKSKTSLLVGLMVIGLQVLAACASFTSTTAGVGINVSVQQAADLRENGALMLDVRTVEEWNEAHIPGASLIPLDQLETRMSEVPTDVPVVIYCRSGNRSQNALWILRDAGMTNVHNMLGGINAWIGAGLATE